MKPSVDLYRGDALAVLADLPSASVDALVTDPPYSSGGMVRGDRMASTRVKYVQTSTLTVAEDFSGDTRDQRSYAYWLALWLGECLRISKPGGVALLFTDWRQLPATTDALQSGGWIWRGIVPWYKPAARPCLGRFTAHCEYVVWGSAGPMDATENPVALPGFYHASAPRKREHQTQKPLEVMRSLVQIAPPDGTVLDPFMGAGTTGVAAVIEGRNFVGVEIGEHYHQAASERIHAAQVGYRARGAQLVLGGSGGLP